MARKTAVLGLSCLDWRQNEHLIGLGIPASLDSDRFSVGLQLVRLWSGGRTSTAKPALAQLDATKCFSVGSPSCRLKARFGLAETDMNVVAFLSNDEE